MGLQMLLDAASFPLFVIVVGILLGVIGNGVYAALDCIPPWLRATGGFMVLMILGVFARELSVLRRLMLRFLGRATVPFSFIDKDFGVKRRGLILTLGFRSHEMGSPVMKEFEVLKPDLLGFLITPDIEKRRVANLITTKFNLGKDSYKEERIDPADVSSVKNSTLRLIHWMERDKGIPLNEIAIDVTGGTTPTSIGAFLAAQERGVDVNYIYSDYDVETNKFIPDTQKALVIKLQ